MLVKIGNTFKDVSNFSVLLFLFMFTYALLGMELYANKIKFDQYNNPVDCEEDKDCLGESLRTNFDSWVNAMITVFILIVGDDWNSYMFDYVRATNKNSILYFMSLVTLGNLILLNLFLAIILKQFEQNHDPLTDNLQTSDLKKVLDKVREWVGRVRQWARAKWGKGRVQKYGEGWAGEKEGKAGLESMVF